MVPLVEQEFLTSGLVIENPNLRAEVKFRFKWQIHNLAFSMLFPVHDWML